MLQLIRSEKLNLSRFEQNIDSIIELCAHEDAAHLRQLNDQLHERHTEIAAAFAGRGDALERILADNSQFSDRFAAFLASLESAVGHSRQLDAIASRPPILKRQLDENTQAIRVWEQKAQSFDAMRQAAMDLLAQSKGKGTEVMGKYFKCFQSFNLFIN
jgi:ABC-type transporter Mla subunit MlaD